MCSLMPPALTIASGSPSSNLRTYAVFAACLAALAGGGWVGFQAAKRSELPMAALLGIIVGLLPGIAALLAFQLWKMQPNLEATSPSLDSPLVWGGAFVAAMITLLAWRWSREPD
jgi:hypothetical protein